MCGECATLDQQVPDQTDMRGASTGGGFGGGGEWARGGGGLLEMGSTVVDSVNV